MQLSKGTLLAATAFGLYILGGLSCFSGIAIVFLFPQAQIFNLGEARGMGYVLICVGLCLSIAGVLFMRFLRNRFIP